MKKTSFAVATLMVAGMASMVFAQDTKKTEAKVEKPKIEAKVEKPKTIAKGEKPKATPGWVVIEEDWSLPFLFDFSTALHDARAHYRAKEDKSASADIDRAASWLKLAAGHGDLKTDEDLSTARYDLMDFSARLKSGKPVLAKRLDAAFAHASVALARHHHFQSSKALSEGDLKMAGRYLMSASDLLRDAAQSANLEYGTEAYDIYDSYAPYGYWDDTIVFEKSKLEENLTTVRIELEKLATKLKTVK